MKIGILTQPLTSNYGGILQNYALQKTLEQLGYDVLTIDYGKSTWRAWFIDTIKVTVKKILRRTSHYKSTPYKAANLQRPLRRFVNEKISLTTPRIEWPTGRILERYNFDALIVGSDQVWRPCYNSGPIEDMYLQFAQDSHIKRIAYAASFGTDVWEYTDDKTKECSVLAKKFDAISVREDSAVPLCLQYLGVESKHVLDPTMLLTANDYLEICKHIRKKEPFVFAYILDETPSVLKEIQAFATKKGLPLLVKSAGPNLIQDDSVELWLSYFRDASYVITDSFHGTVFSIIFNKDFGVFGNHDRGNARFSSLIKDFNLYENVLNSPACIDIKKVDWGSVNYRLESRIIFSRTWLEKSLA